MNAFTDRKARVQGIKQLRGTLKKYGQPVPEGLNEAIDFASLDYRTNRSTDAYAALQSATVDTFTQAADDLSVALAADWVTQSDAFKQKLDEVKDNRVFQAILNAENELYQSLIEPFNELAPEFERACLDLPNLESFNVWQFSATQAQALTDSRNLAAELGELWHGVRSVGRMLGTIQQDDNREVSTFLDQVFMLGNPDTFNRAREAADFLRVDKLNVDQTKPYQPLLPFGALTFRSIPLELKTPREGRRLRQQVQHPES